MNLMNQILNIWVKFKKGIHGEYQSWYHKNISKYFNDSHKKDIKIKENLESQNEIK